MNDSQDSWYLEEVVQGTSKLGDNKASKKWTCTVVKKILLKKQKILRNLTV